MSKTFNVTDYKGIHEVTLTSGCGLVVLAGDNKQGKSSFLDAVREAVRFVGANETPDPIRQGQDEATIEIVDHERERRYVRTFKRSKAGKTVSKFSVFALDGAEYAKPAEILSQDIGAEIIDAGEFARMTSKDQRDTLLRQITLPFDLDEIAAEKKKAEEKRLEAGREVKRLEGALASLPKPAADVPDEEVSSASILTEIEKAQQINADVQRATDLAQELERNITNVDQREAQLKDQLRALVEEREKLDLRRIDAVNDSQGDVIDISPLQAQLQGLDEINHAIRAKVSRAKVAHELSLYEAAHKDAQAKIDQIEQRKREGLAAATFPDPNLSFDDSGVLYEGVPFQQLNDADKRIVGAQILVGASDRKLRIGFLREGDLLDDGNLERLHQVAIAANYTFLVERGRDSSKENGWIFVDGELAS